jgi:hypothetical protein
MQLRAIPDGKETQAEALDRLVSQLGDRPATAEDVIVKLIVTDEPLDGESPADAAEVAEEMSEEEIQAAAEEVERKMRRILYLCSPTDLEGRDVHPRERLASITRNSPSKAVILRMRGQAVRTRKSPLLVGITPISRSGMPRLHRPESGGKNDLSLLMKEIRDLLQEILDMSGYDLSVITMPSEHLSHVLEATETASATASTTPEPETAISPSLPRRTVPAY